MRQRADQLGAQLFGYGEQRRAQVGKGPRNDIVIADPAVSTSHAVIKNENGNYIITDLGSRNGTSINGSKITEPHKLNHGDVIGMGVTKLTFRLSGYSETGVIEMPETTAAIPNMPLPLTQDALANALIAEDTFLMLSGNKLSLAEEQTYVDDSLAEMKPRFDLLHKTRLQDLPMDDEERVWWE